MKKTALLLLLILVSVGEVFAALETPSTQGSEFFFSLMLARSKQGKQISLTVSSPSAGFARFTSPTGTQSTQKINAGITEIILAQLNGSFNDALDSAYAGNTNITGGLYPNCYTTKANEVQQEGYMVETFYPSSSDATKPDLTKALKVSMYAGLSGSSTSDCANVYPIDALGNDYYVISRSGNSVGWRFLGTSKQEFNSSAYYPSEALVVAAEDSTQIDIYPSCLIRGQSQSDTILSKIHVLLPKKGDTYLIQALSSDSTQKGSDDLIGTRIVATDTTGNTCKRFAIFAGSVHGSGVNSPFNNGDLEYDQMFPVHLWGTDYIAGSTTKGSAARSGSDVVRVVASQPCTEVYINGTYATTLNQGDYYQHRDWKDEGTFVHASKPIEAGLFTTGENRLSSDGNADGGPALIVLAPMQQYLRSITFSVYNANNAPGKSNVYEHSLAITSLTSIRDSTYLNGVKLKTGTVLSYPIIWGTANPNWGSLSPALKTVTVNWTTIPSNPKYSQLIIANMNDSISYTLKNTASKDTLGGFTAFVYGSQGSNTGYGYSVGASAASDSTTFILNGSSALSSSSKNKKCVEKNVTFTPQIPSGVTISSVNWDFGDGSPDTSTTSLNNYTASHVYKADGVYTITMIVFKSSTGCFVSATSDTATTQITIKTYKETRNDTISICKASIVKTPLPTDLAAVSRSKISCIWMSKNVAGLDSTLLFQTSLDTLSINLDYGQSRVFWRKSWSSDDNCTLYVDTFTIVVKPKWTDKQKLDTVCYGYTVLCNPPSAAGLSGTPTYTWYNSTGAVIGNTASITLNSSVGVTYGTTTKFWVEADAGCAYVDTVYFTIRPKIQNFYDLGTVCAGKILTSKNQSGGYLVGTPTFTWYNSGGTVIADSVRASLTLNASLGITYGTTTKFWVESNTGCAYVDTFKVAIPAKITNNLTASSNKVCGDGKTLVTVTATQTGPANSNSWEVSTNGSAFVSMNQPAGSLVYSYYPTEDESFRFVSVGTCESDTSTTSVAVNSPFTADLEATSPDFVAPYTLPLSGGTVTLTVTENISNAYSYKWYPVNITATTSQYVDKVTNDISYYVIVSDPDNLCRDTTNTVDIALRKIQLHTLLIPKSENPLNLTFAEFDDTGESLSNTFKFGYTLTIFNRYGQKIFEKKDGGWNGTYNGKIADAGVYFYVLEYSNSENQTKTMKGTIEVVK